MLGVLQGFVFVCDVLTGVVGCVCCVLCMVGCVLVWVNVFVCFV